MLNGCSPNENISISVDELINTAPEHNLRSVRVCGLLTDSIENCIIRTGPLPETYGTEDAMKLIWTSTSSGYCTPNKPDSMQGLTAERWAVVEGVFHTGGRYGHLDGADHEIKASILLVTEEPCR